MIGAVVENLSNRKLFVILSVLLLIQVLFFLVGGLYSPEPSTSMEFLMTKCKDAKAGRSKEWFHIRPQKCDRIESLDHYTPVSADIRDIVFVAQMPHARDGIALEYSPWFQFLLGLLDVEIEYGHGVDLDPEALIELEVRMAYRTKDSKPTDWKEFISTSIVRPLECSIDKEKRLPGYLYNCSTINLFELGSNNYPFYLLNVRIPLDRKRCERDPKAPNCRIGKISELKVVAIHQNGGFTFIWLWMKTLVSPVVLFVTYWYYQRVVALPRPMYLLEKAILALGISLAVLDFPIEWISLWFRLPFMLLVSDIRQGIFYAVLFSFWLIFAGEHLIDDRSRNNLKNYWRNLACVLTASIAFLVYDICERGMQLSNPFYSIWTSETGTLVAYASIYVGIACTVAYFVFLAFKVWRVCTTIRQKRATHFYQRDEKRRLKVEIIIYRFKFLMLLTLACAFLTINSYVMRQYGEGQMHSDDPEDSILTQSTSAFFTGTFGMWNIYVILLLSMYAPSHKHYANAQVLEDENEDLMDSSATETAPMVTFLKPATD
ncbi:CRE-MIG-14 protein [Aphelenchoides avenae]|nr:CRE-MIG-14 protein [Aphelenchus avenae]